MPTALFLSPHLDDVAFSCGGEILRLTDAGWRVVLCTLFAGSVPDPTGFALRCQTDKGIAPEVDYMELRREEDRAYAAASGAPELRHWTYLEAPHRGYGSPAELFDGVRDDDNVWELLRDDLAALNTELDPDVVYAPQGLGCHVDHLITIRAVLAVYQVEDVYWYRDTPYVIRDPKAQPCKMLASDKLCICQSALPPKLLKRKIAGCTLYASQIGFQFGGPEGVRRKLTKFHRSESGGGLLSGNHYAERFLGDSFLFWSEPL